ncbi:hypothetical protein [Candidatus Culexarchaeum yellowstonense]|uniref:hypothetical protein n=1 Tax=Candidatus Culexarchaeum yellowstonense TaxID=2928963 RepID=UPI0026F18BED|nr:hypothetical protein [Candidatus Culexarchaeum yellowstonense]
MFSFFKDFQVSGPQSHGGLKKIDGAGWATLNATYNTNISNNTATTFLNICLTLIKYMVSNRNI